MWNQTDQTSLRHIRSASVAQNIYDDDGFFEKYSGLPRPDWDVELSRPYFVLVAAQLS